MNLNFKNWHFFCCLDERLGELMDKCDLLRAKPYFQLIADYYESDLNRRTTEEVYAQAGVDPYDFDKNTFLGMFSPASTSIALLRRASRWVLPSLMEKAVAFDHPEIKERLREQDQKECLPEE